MPDYIWNRTLRGTYIRAPVPVPVPVSAPTPAPTPVPERIDEVELPIIQMEAEAIVDAIAEGIEEAIQTLRGNAVEYISEPEEPKPTIEVDAETEWISNQVRK